MSAVVLALRFCSRVPQILEPAAFMAALPHNHAEGHLQQQLWRLSEGLRPKGVADEWIRSEVVAYEDASRVQLGCLLLNEGWAA